MDRKTIRSLLLKLSARDVVSDLEAEALVKVFSEEERFATGRIVVPAHVSQIYSRLLLSGVVARSHQLPDGRRQITQLHIAGDFVDLHSFLLKELDHDVIALSPVRLANAPHERVKALSESFPHLIRLLWLTTLIDAAIHREWIVSSGRRSAREQLACLFCELIVRSQIVELGDIGRCPLPLTQEQLADVCGISTVHINRTLQELRAEGVLEFRSRELRVLDFERLARIGMFDPTYLCLKREAR